MLGRLLLLGLLLLGQRLVGLIMGGICRLWIVRRIWIICAGPALSEATKKSSVNKDLSFKAAANPRLTLDEWPFVAGVRDL